MRRRRIWIGLAAVVALTAAYTTWLVISSQLSIVERQVVGIWHLHLAARMAFPRGALVVWEFAPDRSCRAVAHDAEAGQPANVPQMVGHWSVRDGAVICDWELSLLAQAARLLGVRRQGPDRMPIESLTEDTLDLRISAETLYPLTRAPKVEDSAPANDKK